MAPSPTGPFHVGGARSALFNWLFARKHGGTFVLRIEDTDKERSDKKFEHDIVEGLAWLGLDWDEGLLPNGNRLPGMDTKGDFGPYRQSERTEIYEKYLQQLFDKGDVYYCYCTKDELEAQRSAALSHGAAPKYNGHCRNLTTPPPGRTPEVIRFKVPETTVEFKDLVRGKVSFDAALFGDLVIAKDMETPLYNFAVVVDDELMKISHVIRGEEHLSNTPKQILMQRALGFREPIYAHIPLILNADRSKMSKRYGDVALLSYRAKGYLPGALVNFLALLGWHPKDDREVLPIKDLIDEFDLARVQQAGAVFNEEKLEWLNREHLKAMSDKEIAKEILALTATLPTDATYDKTMLEKIVGVERGRASTLLDFITLGGFFFALPDYEPSLLVWKESSAEETRAALAAVRDALAALDQRNFQREILANTVATVIGEKKRGITLWPLRVALSGQKASPDPIEIMEVLGKEESMKRIGTALAKLAK